MTDTELYLAGDIQSLFDRHSDKMRAMLADCYPEADADQAMQCAFAELQAGPEPEYLGNQLRPWLFSRVAKAACKALTA